MTDPLDLPENDHYELLYPFVACASQGGPYDDDAFVAGVQVGRLDRSLELAAAAGADRLSATVYTTLVPQLELAAMARGWPIVLAEQVAETEDHPAMPEWSQITFMTARGAPDA